MARTLKEGLEYFSFECDFFRDRKIRKLLKYNGANGVVIYNYLLCEIYRDKGYYLKYENDLLFDTADALSLEMKDISRTIENCFKIGLFDLSLYQKYTILTSFGIQKRYKEVTKRRSNLIKPEYVLNESSEEKIKQTLTIQFPEEIPTRPTTVNKPPLSNPPPDDIKAEDYKPIVDELMRFFNLNEQNNFRQMADFTVFAKDLIRDKRINYFNEQFPAYKEYKELKNEEIHSPQGFMDNWDSQNWVMKLKKLNDGSRQEISEQDPNAELKARIRSRKNASPGVGT